MADWIERLGLDRDLIERDREMAAGLGRAYLRMARNPEHAKMAFVHAMAGATEYRRAGAHSLLVGDRDAARSHFAEAGELYLRFRNPYGLLMFGCAGIAARDVEGPAREYGLLERVERLQKPYLILAGAAGGWYRSGDEDESGLGGSKAKSIGMFGLPLGVYLDLARAVSEDPITNRQAVVGALMPFLSVYSNSFVRARENTYHWQKLAMPFHPAEPDVLGVLCLVESALRERGESFPWGALRELQLAELPMKLLQELLLEVFESGEERRR